jgi:hypothetical protein
MFNSANLSSLPYEIQKKSTTKSTNFSSQMRTTNSNRMSSRASRVTWRAKNVNASGFRVRNRQDLIDYSCQMDYFEQEVDGEMKLFRKRLVPKDELEEFGQE